MPSCVARGRRTAPRTARRGGWWVLGILLVGLWLAGLGAEAGSAADLPSLKEHQVKAAFVYNFAKFVEWPTNRSAGTTNLLRIAQIP